MTDADRQPIITVKRIWQRPDPALVAAFATVPTGNVSDAAGRTGSLGAAINPVTSAASFCGPALTIDAGPHDNLAVWVGLDLIAKGDVVVISTHQHQGCAVVGDLIASFARSRGAAAIVTDGLVRDVKALADLDMPVFAAGVCPNGPGKDGPGSVGLPIEIGAVRVSSGDLIVGDRDGVVRVTAQMLEDARGALAGIVEKEAGMEADADAGKLTPGNIDSILSRVLIHEID